MKELLSIKKVVVTAMCTALCIVLPLAFHMIPNFGSVFSPMHLPVLLCGLICGWPLGLICGLLGPALSSLITGMPAAPYLPPMMVELAVYGIVSGLLYGHVRTKSIYSDLYISLIPAMLIGRVIAGLARALILTPGGFTFAMWASSYFAKSLPGIIVHLILIPGIVIALEKAKLIPIRYSKPREIRQ